MENEMKSLATYLVVVEICYFRVRDCYANILPSTGHVNNIAQLKTDKWL